MIDLRTDNGVAQQQLADGAPATQPTQQTSWVASAPGPGAQQLSWAPAEGRWAAVVINADGSRPVVTDLSAGATAPACAGRGSAGTSVPASD